MFQGWMIVSSYRGAKTKQEGPWWFLLEEITNCENRETLSYKAHCALTDCSVVITYLMLCGLTLHMSGTLCYRSYTEMTSYRDSEYTRCVGAWVTCDPPLCTGNYFTSRRISVVVLFHCVRFCLFWQRFPSWFFAAGCGLFWIVWH